MVVITRAWSLMRVVAMRALTVVGNFSILS